MPYNSLHTYEPVLCAGFTFLRWAAYVTGIGAFCEGMGQPSWAGVIENIDQECSITLRVRSTQDKIPPVYFAASEDDANGSATDDGGSTSDEDDADDGEILSSVSDDFGPPYATGKGKKKPTRTSEWYKTGGNARTTPMDTEVQYTTADDYDNWASSGFDDEINDKSTSATSRGTRRSRTSRGGRTSKTISKSAKITNLRFSDETTRVSSSTAQSKPSQLITSTHSNQDQQANREESATSKAHSASITKHKMVTVTVYAGSASVGRERTKSNIGENGSQSSNRELPSKEALHGHSIMQNVLSAGLTTFSTETRMSEQMLGQSEKR
jgi:hypothetical protein